VALPSTMVLRFTPEGLLPKSCHPQRGRELGSSPHTSHKRTISPEAYKHALPHKQRGRSGTFTGQYRQPLCSGDATKHPIRPDDGNRNSTAEEGLRLPTLQTRMGLSAPQRPKRDTSRTIRTWSLRHRLLPPDAVYIPLKREFEFGFPHGYGPARVGLDLIPPQNETAPF